MIDTTLELQLMSDRSNRICPVEAAGSLDNRFRKWIQPPQKILKPYVREGMTVLDIGCGPGFFTIELARMVGNSGRVIACDVQEGMLEKVRKKIRGTELEKRITLVLSSQNKIGTTELADLILTFWVVHEAPDQRSFLKEIFTLIKPNGRFLLVEPTFHVTKRAFSKTIDIAQEIGFRQTETPKIIFSRAAVLELS